MYQEKEEKHSPAGNASLAPVIQAPGRLRQKDLNWSGVWAAGQESLKDSALHSWLWISAPETQVTKQKSPHSSPLTLILSLKLTVTRHTVILFCFVLFCWQKSFGHLMLFLYLTVFSVETKVWTELFFFNSVQYFL